MTNKTIENICQKFPSEIVETHDYRGDATIIVKKNRVIDILRFLKKENDTHFDMLTDLCGIDRLKLNNSTRFEVVYHLLSLETHERIRVRAQVPEEDPTIDSATSLWKASGWFERETSEMFGIRFLNHPNLKKLLLFDGFEGYPLRKDYPINKRPQIPTPEENLLNLSSDGTTFTEGEHLPTKSMSLNIGPSHPAMHGALRYQVELDGETISRAHAEIGYLHRAFEKHSEENTYTQVIPYTDRLNYCSAVMNNVGFAHAVEKLLGIEIPERAKVIRVIASELFRIMDHLVCLGAVAVDLGALTSFWYFFDVREQLYDFTERLTGARLTTNYTRIGGVANDLPPDFPDGIRKVLKNLDKAIGDVTSLLERNRIFIDRTRNIGVISKEEAISWSYTGPCVRASGIPYDVRKDQPYYDYDQYDFDIPIGSTGDVNDRLMVRFEEMRQSSRIVKQALDRLVPGPIMVDDPTIALPPKPQVYGSIEGLMNQFMIVTQGICPPPGETYSATEAANGELGFYIVSDGGARPYRVRCRPPCFPLTASSERMVEGHMVADLIAIVGSLNIVVGELDR